MHESLRDAHVLITGAGTGIGAATAAALSSARLTLVGRTEATLRAVADPLGAAVLVADVRDLSALRSGVAATVDAQGPLRAVVANAGIGGPDGDDERFAELVATNLVGTWNTFAAARPHLAERAHLLAVSSILARIGVPGYGGYCASKAGVLGLVRALAMELAPRGVQVNALCPGWVDTAMARQGIEGFARDAGVSFEQARAGAMAQVPMGRMSTPEEIAGWIAFLLSDGARGITGQGIDVNHGAWLG